MKISFSACIAILSASPPSADIFVEGASFRGLMSKLSSRTTTADDNNNNAQGTTAATADEVVHVELDSHAIALAETTDVHPHLATSDPEQVDRHLSACTQAAASEYYTPPKLPDCSVPRRHGIQRTWPVGPMDIVNSSPIATPHRTRPRLHVATVHTEDRSVECVSIRYPIHPRAAQPTWARVCTIPITPPIGSMRRVLTIARGHSPKGVVPPTRI